MLKPINTHSQKSQWWGDVFVQTINHDSQTGIIFSNMVRLFSSSHYCYHYTVECRNYCHIRSTVTLNDCDKSRSRFWHFIFYQTSIYLSFCVFIAIKKMLTHYIGNITRVEPGQIIVVVGKTTDAAARYFLIHTSRLIVQINC